VVVEVRFTEWTSAGHLRHPTFLGLREDKMPSQVKRESPVAVLPGLTHPDKVLYPDQGITKRDLASYYQKVSSLMLPHVADRPLALMRCPEGRTKSCFYQKHLTGGSPDALRRISIRQSDGTRVYGVVDDEEGLLALVQMGVLEMHVWGARADKVERPDRIVVDLDPGAGVTWAQLCEAAREVRALLAQVGLETWVKTSGGKGIHVVAPIERRSTWDEVSDFARGVARALEEHAPDRYLSRATKAERGGKIFVDWLRNTRGATAVGVWSTRARAGAPVSRPCEWSELEGLERSDSLTVGDILHGALPYRKDPWAGMLKARQRLRTPG
jgi:bifunctional non-homologous end joining protein LigD